MDLTEKTRQLSEKYNLECYQINDLLVYKDFKRFVKHPLRTLFSSRETREKNDEVSYALVDRYLQRRQYKMSQGTATDLIPVYDF